MITLSALARAELAPSGTIRVAVNTANAAAVIVAGNGDLSGPCIDLARGLGAAIVAPVELLRFASAGQIIAAEQAGDAWDVAFLAADPARVQRLHFSSPYLTIEAGYAVPADSSIAEIGDVDSPGKYIATSAGAAYDLYLDRTLHSAKRCPFPNPAASFAAFEAGGYDAVAGVRLSLERHFGGRKNTRLLPGHFLAIYHSIVVPIGRQHAADVVDKFLDRYLSRVDRM